MTTCGAPSPSWQVGVRVVSAPCIRPAAHLGSHQAATGLVWGVAPTVPETPASLVAADTIREHMPAFRSTTGPIAGCACGDLQLGESWSWHVVAALARAGVTFP